MLFTTTCDGDGIAFVNFDSYEFHIGFASSLLNVLDK